MSHLTCSPSVIELAGVQVMSKEVNSKKHCEEASREELGRSATRRV